MATKADSQARVNEMIAQFHQTLSEKAVNNELKGTPEQNAKAALESKKLADYYNEKAKIIKDVGFVSKENEENLKVVTQAKQTSESMAIDNEVKKAVLKEESKKLESKLLYYSIGAVIIIAAVYMFKKFKK